MIVRRHRRGGPTGLVVLIAAMALVGGCGKKRKGSKTSDSTPGARTAEAGKGTAAKPATGSELGPGQRALLQRTAAGILGTPGAGAVGGASPADAAALRKLGIKQPIPAVSTRPIRVQLNAVLGVNVAKVRQSFLWPEILADRTYKHIVAGATYQKICKAIDLDPPKVTDRIVVAMASRRWRFASPDHVVVVFEGRFDTDKVMTALEALPPGTLGYTKAQKLAGKRALLVVAPELLPFVLVAVKKNVLAFASPEIAANVAMSRPGFGDEALSKRAASIDRKALAWGVFGRLDLPFGAAGGLGTTLTALSQVLGGSVQLDPKARQWNVALKVDAKDETTAMSLTTLLGIGKAAVATGAASKSLPPLLVNLVQKVQLDTKGKTIHATVSLSKTDAKAIARVLLGQFR